MQAMKIRIKDEDHCKKVQEALFNLGYSWGFYGKNVSFEHANHLYAYTDGDICYDMSDDAWDGCCSSHVEYHLNDSGELTQGPEPVEQSKPPVGLRPRKIALQARMNEILHAMLRYSDEGLSLPDEWVSELVEVNIALNDENFKEK